MRFAGTMTRHEMRNPVTRGAVSSVLLVLLAAVLAPSSCVPLASAADNDRTGWMVGVGFLLGSADLTTNSNFEPGWVSGVTPQFRFGYMAVEQRLLVSLENKQWTREKGSPPSATLPPGVDFIKYQVASQVFNLVLTGFPGRPESFWGGFYVNAGVGPAVARFDTAVVDTLYSGEDPPEVVAYEWGWGWFVGGGYEYRFVDNVAAGLSLNYVYADIKGEYIERSKIWTLAFNLNWYF